MSVQELYADHPKLWTNIHCNSMTSDNLQMQNVNGIDSSRMKIPVYAALPAVPAGGHTCYDQATSKLYHSDGVNWIDSSGDVSGAGAATDNALARWDGATGKLLQDSNVLLDDADNISAVNDLSITRLTFNDTDYQTSLTPDHFHALKLPAGPTFTDDTVTPVDLYNSVSGTISADFNITTGIWTVGSDGLYNVQSTLLFLGDATTTGYRRLDLINGTSAHSNIMNAVQSATVGTFVNASSLQSLTAGTLISLTGRQTSGGGLVLNNAWFSVSKLGPI